MRARGAAWLAHWTVKATELTSPRLLPLHLFRHYARLREPALARVSCGIVALRSSPVTFLVTFYVRPDLRGRVPYYDLTAGRPYRPFGSIAQLSSDLYWLATQDQLGRLQ